MSDGSGPPRMIEGAAILRPAPFGPVSCSMPDLSDIASPVMLDYTLNAILRGAGPTDPKALAYLNGFIRVTDKALLEYEAARAVLDLFCVSRNRASLYLRAVAHLETCIHSLKRAQRFLQRLKGTLRRPGMPRENRKLVAKRWDAVTKLRDAIEHMDEWIQKDKLAEGALIVLSVNKQGDAMEIAGQELSFDSLAALLRDLHAIATVLADYREVDQATA